MKVVTAYTDGSSIKQIKDSSKYHGGAGVVLVCGEHKKEISIPLGYATVNIAELTAPIEGLKALKKKCKVTIFMREGVYTLHSNMLINSSSFATEHVSVQPSGKI